MNLKNLICIAMITIITCGLAFAESSEFKDKREKISYCVGLDIGQNFKNGEWDLDIEAVIEGVRHSFTGSEWKLEKDEMMRVISDYRQELQQEQMKLDKAKAELNKTAGDKFLEENAKKKGITVLPSGLQYEIITKGDGNSPSKTDSVEVHYKGTLIDGTEFDSSYTRGKPVTFDVDKVIPGWTEILQLMKEKAKWRVYIPSDLAYGPRGAGKSIGPNTTLIFDIELLKINPEK